jgi:homoserine dehydrogenase
MTRLGLDYGEALKQAQALGYAEANPSTDVEGIDTWHKLILSANIGFGVSLERENVPAAGISTIGAEDIANFKAHGYVCKLVSVGKNYGEKCGAYVQPTLFPMTALEAAVPTNFNLITLDGDVSGRQSFYGQGAGRYPTAYNVVQDCVSILGGRSFYCPYGKKTPIDNSEKLRYYIRGNWQGEVEETWGNAVVTKPIAVSDVHSWLKDNSGAFIAAIAE